MIWVPSQETCTWNSGISTLPLVLYFLSVDPTGSFWDRSHGSEPGASNSERFHVRNRFSTTAPRDPVSVGTLWGFTNPTIASTCWCVGLIWDRQFTMAGIRSIHPPIPIRSWWTAHGWDPGSRNPTYGSSIDISISRSTGVLDVFLSNHSWSHAAHMLGDKTWKIYQIIYWTHVKLQFDVCCYFLLISSTPERNRQTYQSWIQFISNSIQCRPNSKLSPTEMGGLAINNFGFPRGLTASSPILGFSPGGAYINSPCLLYHFIFPS